MLESRIYVQILKKMGRHLDGPLPKEWKILVNTLQSYRPPTRNIMHMPYQDEESLSLHLYYDLKWGVLWPILKLINWIELICIDLNNIELKKKLETCKSNQNRKDLGWVRLDSEPNFTLNTKNYIILYLGIFFLLQTLT